MGLTNEYDKGHFQQTFQFVFITHTWIYIENLFVQMRQQKQKQTSILCIQIFNFKMNLMVL